MDTEQSSIQVKYPEVHPGTAVTEISFCGGGIDLNAVYAPGGDRNRRRCFVTDATVATLPAVEPFVSRFDDGVCGGDILLILGSGEPYKTTDSVLEIVRRAVDAGLSRGDLFVGIGGGVICDMTGFAASIFKRGAAVQFVPTTLLAMVDAAIGGKTGCDFDSYKNMIGAFFPAERILIFPQFVRSLPDGQFRSGLAEALKTALLYDADLYDVIRTRHEDILMRKDGLVGEIIRRCASAKAKVVEQDFMEKDVRMFLNFGHTFAHALETIVGLGNVTHGDAVAWGIGRALALCAREEICRESYRDDVFGTLRAYGWETAAVPAVVTGGGAGERFLNVMRKDKKNRDDKITLVLQRAVTETFTQKVEDKKILAVLS